MQKTDNGLFFRNVIDPLFPRAAAADGYGGIFRAGGHADRDRLTRKPGGQETGNVTVSLTERIHNRAGNDPMTIPAFTPV